MILEPPVAVGSGLRLDRRCAAVQLLAALLGTLLLTLGSWIEVPMPPVPMTMQTFAVTTIGALYGARLGTITVLAWLGEAALGMPVLAGGASGFHHLAGPTGGYLLAFPLVAGLLGWAADRGWFGAGAPRGLGLMLAADALILALGAGWLAGFIGIPAALRHGVVPFLLGSALKAALSAAVVEAAERLGRPINRRAAAAREP